MTSKFTYWSDVNTTALDDSDSDTQLQWVHALSLGEYEHPVHGTLKFTPERVAKFVASVKNKVRGIDPDIDYDHKRDTSKGMSAAGWVRDAEQRDNGLWLLVEWTKKAAQAIRDREYRYFSAEFVDKWKSPKGEEFEDVVLGGGLTNRPFLKDLEPVNLSELAVNEKENVMELAELARILGLAEDTSEDVVKTKLNELVGSAKLDLTKLSAVEADGKVTVTHPDVEGEFVYELSGKKQEEDDSALTKLAEENPAIAKLLTENKTMKTDVEELKAAQRLSEVTTQLSELGTDHKVALPPVVQNKLSAVMVQVPKALSDNIAEALKELMKVGIVEFDERSSTRPPSVDEGAIEKYLSEIERVKTEKKLSTRDAQQVIIKENPELHENYKTAVRLGEES